MADTKSGKGLPESKTNIETGLAQRVLSMCGGMLILAGAGCLLYAAYMVVRFGPYTLPDTLNVADLGPINILTREYSGPVVLLVAAVLGIVLGRSIMGKAIDATADIIPKADRETLHPLIADGNEKGINQYIRLASLTGVSGFFTKLGFTGMPLVTAILGVLLILLAMIETDDKMAPQLLDLAKLVIGAFIGSFVQKKVTQQNVEQPAQVRPEDTK